jgi:hypothetical protein
MTSTRIAFGSPEVTSSTTGPPLPYLTEFVTSSDASSLASGSSDGLTVPVNESRAERATAGARRSLAMSTRRIVMRGGPGLDAGKTTVVVPAKPRGKT